MNTHQVSIVPVESPLSYPTADAVCQTPGCGWFASGRASTVIAVSMDHADNR